MHLFILCMLGSNDSILHHQLCDALYLLWVIQYPKALVMNYNVLVQHHTLPDTNFPFFLVLRQDMVLSSCYGRRLYARTAPPPCRHARGPPPRPPPPSRRHAATFPLRTCPPMLRPPARPAALRPPARLPPSPAGRESDSHPPPPRPAPRRRRRPDAGPARASGTSGQGGSGMPGAGGPAPARSPSPALARFPRSPMRCTQACQGTARCRGV
jgi:hypothetical protein